MIDRVRREPPPGKVARDGMMQVISDQHARLSQMQIAVDEMAERWMRHLAVNSSEDLAAAIATYDKAWFESKPYSHHMKVRIAQRLLDMARPYSFADVHAWEDIVGEKP